VIRVFDSAHWADLAADVVAEDLRAAVEARGTARIALAGGSTPRPVYQALATRDLPWAKVEVFFGDERAVPPDDPESNFAMAHASLLSHVPAGRVERIEGEREDAVARYVEALGSAPLDLVLLGMGDDGHTASLFPESSGDPDARVVRTESPKPPPQRISLGLRALNEARRALFLVTGAAKSRRVQEVLETGSALPAAKILGASWLLDEAAASALQKATVKT